MATLRVMMKRLLITILLFFVHHKGQQNNPMVKEFEDERKTYLSKDMKRVKKKLEKVMSRLEGVGDPSRGFPVVTPKAIEKKILRHLLLFNRLSPPNSLRAAEISKKNEFYIWLDNNPGRGAKIVVTLKAMQSVAFPDINLKAHRPFSRTDLDEHTFDSLSDTLKITWEGLLQNRRLRVDIPVILKYDVEEGDKAEFRVQDVKFTGLYNQYEYEAWAKPTIIRWRVGPPAEVKFTIGSGSGEKYTSGGVPRAPIRIAVPDGRYRKFRVWCHNKLVTKYEFFTLNLAPLIDRLEGDPLSYYSGFSYKEPGGFFTGPASQWKPKKWLRITKRRGDGIYHPYFQGERFWPWVFCEHPEVIPRNSYALHQIAEAIPEIADRWHSTEQSLFHFGGRMNVGDFRGSKERAEMRDMIMDLICNPKKYKVNICKGPEGDGPSAEQLKSTRCGNWPESMLTLFKPKKFQEKKSTFGLFGNQKGRKLKYKIHTAMQEGTAITLMFGFYAGVLESAFPSLNERFRKMNSNWFLNSPLYVSTAGTNKQLRIKCKRGADIGQKKCCRIKMPLNSFYDKRHEQEFDLAVVSANQKRLKLYGNKGFGLRLKFRKGWSLLTGMDETKKKFCYKPLKYGKTQVRFEILEACYSLKIGKRMSCQGLGQTEKKRAIGRNEPGQMAPMDFKPPPAVTLQASILEQESIKVLVAGEGQGDITQVINGEWFEIIIYFTEDIEGDVTIRALSPKFEFEPSDGVGGVLSFHKDDGKKGTWMVKADVDCPSPTMIVIINYMILVDDFDMWKTPKPSYIQVAPSEADVESQNDANLNTTLCQIPEEECMALDVLGCGTPKQLGQELLCEKVPMAPGCVPPEPMKPKKGWQDDPENKRWLAIMMMWTAAGLMVFTVLYRNLCSGDTRSMKKLQEQMTDLTESIKRPKIPADAIDASEFTKLAGFDEDQVFNRRNPDPIVLAQAQFSLKKMLGAIKST